MEEAPENGKESPHSVHADGLIDRLIGRFLLYKILMRNGFLS